MHNAFFAVNATERSIKYSSMNAAGNHRMRVTIRAGQIANVWTHLGARH